MSKLIEVLLLCALPASGKSETRKYLETRTGEECRENFHFGKTVQLDDYPYVHMMRVVDQALGPRNQPYVFFESPDKCFQDGRDWGTLLELINEDYSDVINVNRPTPKNVSGWLLDRYDRCRKAVGAKPLFSVMDSAVRKQLEDDIRSEAEKLLVEKNKGIPDSLEGCTIVIEFARGGAETMTMPIPAPYGYQYSLGILSPDLLAKAAMLYIWVTPEQSRAKNRARADPNNPGSILNHGVPEYVMRNDYGADDLTYLVSQSDVPHSIKVHCTADGKYYYLPVGIFDNREDFTTFARTPVPSWKAEDVAKIQKGIKIAMDHIAENYFKKH